MSSNDDYELRSMVMMIDPEEQKKAEDEMKKSIKEYLIFYMYNNEDDIPTKEWELIEGKQHVIEFIRGLMEAKDITVDIDNSYVLVDSENIRLSERITMRDFIEYVNKSLEDPIVM